ncbi:hypothetical protein CU098_004639 [Rhizopus stolonifer]|uniref:Uncharacterized protein n=1 Tax=Rhizopus stolonifer TaxID=4846 RepID=A0A367INB9_RHIST|nr:hypothetical protein CU098_004639 [Rhizopus stolonifer]
MEHVYMDNFYALNLGDIVTVLQTHLVGGRLGIEYTYDEEFTITSLDTSKMYITSQIRGVLYDFMTTIREAASALVHLKIESKTCGIHDYVLENERDKELVQGY